MPDTINDDLSRLPADLHLNFSKWFYADIDSIKPKPRSGRASERGLEQEVVPLRSISENLPDNSLNRDKLRFLTDDLDKDELVPIKQIRDYKLTLVEVEPETEAYEMDSQSKKRDMKKLQLLLQSNYTIIDRRPLLKKRRPEPAVNNVPRRDDSSQSCSTILIEPNEDCDGDSIEDEILEIDCDDV